MVELYKVKSGGEITEIEKAPFPDETKELENFVMRNEGILGNVSLLNHQIILPDRKKIDVWGLDTLDFRPVIVELKNAMSGIEVIPQILPYYNFVKSNPDTLRLKALSHKNFMKKLEGREIDNDKLVNGLAADPKVIIVAPAFKKELLDVVDYIKIDIELVEIFRYETEEGDFLVSINKPLITSAPPITVRVMEEWDWNKYQKAMEISEKKIEIAKGLKEQLDDIIAKNEINLKPIFRQLYIPYQYGRKNVFWIDIGYTSWTAGDVVLWFYLDKEPNLKSENIKIEHTKTKWYENYKQWLIFFERVVDLSPLTPIIKKSYEYVTGLKITE